MVNYMKAVQGAVVGVMLALIVSLALVVPAFGEEMKLDDWKKIDPAKITDNPITLFGKDWMLLSAGKPGDMNTMTVGWGALGGMWGLENATVTVYVDPTRYTHEFMEKYEYFTLSAFPEKYRKALLFLGSRSGRDGDKIAASGLTVQFTELDNPMFEEARMVLECRKIYAAPLSYEGMSDVAKKVYPDGRVPHTMYIGEITNAWIK